MKTKYKLYNIKNHIVRFLVFSIAVFTLALFFASPGVSQNCIYLWLTDSINTEKLTERIPPPEGYKRIDVKLGSFEEWLRHLPLYEGRPPVYLYNGREKSNQKAHYAVVNIDVGNKDIQQCADAVIRLRAEYLFSCGDYDSIQFNFTSGDKATFKNWINGSRPLVDGNKVEWIKSAKVDSSYNSFRKYLNIVFMYAGSYSLSSEMEKVNDIKNMKTGDVFIQGGFPGHAVIVVDIAVNIETGHKVFLLAQSYMPAQQIHILKNPNDSQLSPWYSVDFGDTLFTPEWVFKKDDLMRFR
jgi:hypothetical protein